MRNDLLWRYRGKLNTGSLNVHQQMAKLGTKKLDELVLEKSRDNRGRDSSLLFRTAFRSRRVEAQVTRH